MYRGLLTTPPHRPIPINFVPPTNFFPSARNATGRKSRVRDFDPSISVSISSCPRLQFNQPSPPHPLYRLLPRAHYSNGRRLKGTVVNFLFNLYRGKYIYIYTCILASSIDARMKLTSILARGRKGDRGLKGGESRAR